MDAYEDIKSLGRGAFATVRLVRKKVDNEYLVVKRFHVPMNELSLKERLEVAQEVKLLAHLSHTNIIRFVDNFVEKGIMHIVMEYCPGGTLDKKIIMRDGELLEENQIWEWFVQIVLALKYVHAHNVLHRDLKTQNIMLGGPQQRTIKLGDFGIAKILGTQGDMANTMVGTPHYLSPELCQGQVYDQKSDVWALGCVLYELTALFKPFDASNMPAIIFSIMRNKPPKLPSCFSKDLIDMVDRLLQPNPKDRPTLEQLYKMPIVQTHLKRWEQTCRRLSKPLPKPGSGPGRRRTGSTSRRRPSSGSQTSGEGRSSAAGSVRGSLAGSLRDVDSSTAISSPARGVAGATGTGSGRSIGGAAGGAGGPVGGQVTPAGFEVTPSVRTLEGLVDGETGGGETAQAINTGLLSIVNEDPESRSATFASLTSQGSLDSAVEDSAKAPLTLEALEHLLHDVEVTAEGDKKKHVRLLRAVADRLNNPVNEGIDGQTWERMGAAWAELARFDDAIEAYRRALRAKAGHASLGAMEQLGNLLVRRAQQIWAMAKAGEWSAAKKVAGQVLLAGVSAESKRRGQLILMGASSRSVGRTASTRSLLSATRSVQSGAKSTASGATSVARGDAGDGAAAEGDRSRASDTKVASGAGDATPIPGDSGDSGGTRDPESSPATGGAGDQPAPGSLVDLPEVDSEWRDAAAALMMEGLGLLERLCLLGGTPERRALLGSAYKRRAWTGLGDSRKADLSIASENYGIAARLEGSSVSRYARLNELMLEFLASSTDAEQSAELLDGVKEVERVVKRSVEKNPKDVWLWVQLADAKFLRWMLLDSSVKLQTLTNDYVEQFAFGASSRVQGSVMDQFEFMVEVLSGRLDEEDDEAVNDLVHKRLNMVVKLHEELTAAAARLRGSSDRDTGTIEERHSEADSDGGAGGDSKEDTSHTPEGQKGVEDALVRSRSFAIESARLRAARSRRNTPTTTGKQMFTFEMEKNAAAITSSLQRSADGTGPSAASTRPPPRVRILSGDGGSTAPTSPTEPYDSDEDFVVPGRRSSRASSKPTPRGTAARGIHESPTDAVSHDGSRSSRRSSASVTSRRSSGAVGLPAHGVGGGELLARRTSGSSAAAADDARSPFGGPGRRRLSIETGAAVVAGSGPPPKTHSGMSSSGSGANWSGNDSVPRASSLRQVPGNAGRGAGPPGSVTPGARLRNPYASSGTSSNPYATPRRRRNPYAIARESGAQQGPRAGRRRSSDKSSVAESGVAEEGKVAPAPAGGRVTQVLVASESETSSPKRAADPKLAIDGDGSPDVVVVKEKSNCVMQ